MARPTIDPTPEVEQARLERLAEMSADEGPAWAEGFEPGSFGCHELLDRVSIACNFLDENILSHPACVRNAEWYALAHRAVEALQELYQRVGASHLDEPGPSRQAPGCGNIAVDGNLDVRGSS